MSWLVLLSFQQLFICNYSLDAALRTSSSLHALTFSTLGGTAVPLATDRQIAPVILYVLGVGDVPPWALPISTLKCSFKGETLTRRGKDNKRTMKDWPSNWSLHNLPSHPSENFTKTIIQQSGERISAPRYIKIGTVSLPATSKYIEPEFPGCSAT